MIQVIPEERTHQRNIMVSNYSKQKLLSYANSLMELANCFKGDYVALEEEREQALERKKIWESKEMLSENLKELSELLNNLASEIFRASVFPGKEYRRIVQALKWEKIFVRDLYVMENGVMPEGVPFMFSLSMYTSNPKGMKTEDVADLLSVLMDRRLTVSVTSPCYVDGNLRNYVFMEESKFYLLHGVAKAIKEKEDLSGDHYQIVESEQGVVTAMLSDGMGSGVKAEEDSKLVVEMVEHLLEAGFHPEVALRLVNNSLLALGEGLNMSTLDMCTLNLYSGSCEFRKVGGAPSFLKSGIYIEQISNYSLPLGAVSIKEDGKIRRELIDQDYIILITDGVLDALGEENPEMKLINFLEKIKEKDPNRMAKAILEYVLHCSKGRIKDDMTILVLGVFLNK